jgi:CRISPR-associated protein Csh2
VNRVVKNRSEILFLFESHFNNPNGDPIFENKPHIDMSDGKCLISPYRIKRTIRDYLREELKEKVLINNYNQIPPSYLSENTIIVPVNLEKAQTGDDLSQIIFSNFIDTRLFGIALPLKKKNQSLEFYGPVQFSYARSLHAVDLLENQGTAAFASSSGKRNRSFRKEYLIPYALFSLYGVINENSALKTQLRQDDCLKLEQALWRGTNILHSRSKTGFKSRLLMRIIYSEENFQLNLGDNVFNLIHEIDERSLRSIGQVRLNINDLLLKMQNYGSKIKEIRIIENTVPIQGYDDIFTAFDEYEINYKEISI